MAAKDTKLGRYVEANGVQVADLARVAGVKRDTLRKIIAGQLRPGIDTAKRIIRATCGVVHYSDLYGDPLAEPA